MPFDPSFRDHYELGIKPACVESGAVCIRVDEQPFLENILKRIYRQIGDADIVIDEMTGRNPNVYYEIGYAHGIGKSVVLLTRNADDIPFDLKHYPHIVYGNSITDLKTQLSAKIRWCLENPDELLGPLIRTDDPDLDQIGVQIENYLSANGYTKISFARIASVMNIPEERVRALIHRSPSTNFHKLA
jgi:hypothetical protein